jgi:hypothetical protein
MPTSSSKLPRVQEFDPKEWSRYDERYYLPFGKVSSSVYIRYWNAKLNTVVFRAKPEQMDWLLPGLVAEAGMILVGDRFEWWMQEVMYDPMYGNMRGVEVWFEGP